MTLSPVLRKAALTAHVATSVGWLGAALGFLTLAVTGLTSADPEVTRAVDVTLDLLTRFALVPLALASLLGGLVQALFTPWGLFRHYWVLVKLVLTVVAAVVLLLQVAPIRALAGGQASSSSEAVRDARMSMVAHSAGGSLVLLVITGLSVFKPRGTTGLGERRTPPVKAGGG